MHTAAAVCLWLESQAYLSRADLRALLAAAGDIAVVPECPLGEWINAGVAPASCRRLRDSLPELGRASAGAAALDGGVAIIPLTSPDYPALLRVIDDPPPWLYCLGDVSTLSRPQVAMVGSRKASPAGLRAARELSAAAAEAGLAVCSGLALGIDGAAHRGALAAGGKTVAVLATGIDRIYPRRHAALAQEVAENGCLVTEMPPGTPPRRQYFPQRNRIVSGMTLATVIVEAALPSGSLITAALALAQGREVLAVPWSMFHAGGRGCLQLLRDGAAPVARVEDILDNLGWFRMPAPEHAAAPVAGGNDDAVLRCVDFEPTPADEVCRRSALPLAQTLAALAALEMAGDIERCDAGFVRCR